MSRADWSFLEHLLEEGQEYSTGIGRIWLTVLFLFRMLVLGAAAESAWDDEQADFVCNTKQPGCTSVCYDKAFPISHFRYFVLQVIFVSTPTIFYFGYVAIRARNDTAKEEEEKKEEVGGRRGTIVIEGGKKNVTRDNAEGKEKKEDVGKDRRAFKVSSQAPKLKGRLLCAYAFSILLKVLLEAGFLVGLWILYGGFIMAAKFECTRSPCPYTVDCFVSRPTEKTIFTIYTQAIAAISLLLNLIELLHLLQLAITHRLEKRYCTPQQVYLPQSEQVPAGQKTPEIQTEGLRAYNARGHVNHQLQGEATCYSNPSESYRDLPIEVNWGPEETGSDLLPSYLNCMGAMRTSHSPRTHYKKQTHHLDKKSKNHKGHSKQKHYV
ncbi:gap junction alpha-4 protein-like [Solea senegalensis]|uniref:Gap junction alpha-4 protein-like n=1 Tax=Solea senegalensis TaxID=28829 RepID=A0AAV6R8N2_SOLSE|nr:gap junction protein alpha 4 [Solea senegalensis]KAG7500914.1 gap junction alpha-4 protein-like [Solea senegalensis]